MGIVSVQGTKITSVSIPMAEIPHPRGGWREAVNPTTNKLWAQVAGHVLAEGGKYCALQRNLRNEWFIEQKGSYNDLLDLVGRDRLHESLKMNEGDVLKARGLDLYGFQWTPEISPEGFNEESQPVVNVSWAHAKGWTLAVGGVYLLTDDQWEYSAKGGEKNMEYATETGELYFADGRKLAHCSWGSKEERTIDVDDLRYADGPFGLRHKTGNVLEWVEENPYEDNNIGLRGGAWNVDNEDKLRAWFRDDTGCISDRDDAVGFRVGAPQDSK